MEFKKAKLENTITDVIEYENYFNINKEGYNNIAVEKEGLLYPLRNITDTKPGLYDYNHYTILVEPNEKEKENYVSSDKVIDFKSETTQEAINKFNQYKQMEYDILNTVDKNGISIYTIKPSNSPEMKALKEAINEKGIDIKKYEYRFGKNFPNDIRILNQDNITLEKLKSFAEKLDMDITLTISDKEGNIPNPIGKDIVVDILKGSE